MPTGLFCLCAPLDSLPFLVFCLIYLSISFLISVFGFSVDWVIGFGDCGSVCSEVIGLYFCFVLFLFFWFGY